jgi:hypothetical protein
MDADDVLKVKYRNDDNGYLRWTIEIDRMMLEILRE